VFDASNDPVGHLADVEEDMLLEHCRARARAALAAGITTIRDLGDRQFITLRLRHELAAHPERGPQLLVSGPPMTIPGGHCWFLGGEAAGVEGVRAAVRTLATREVDVVKVMVTGGNLTPGSVPWQSQYDVAELRVAVEERLLEREVEIDHVNRLGWTALLEAIILGGGDRGHTEVVRLLVEAGADVNLADGQGVTPLTHARRQGYDEIAAILRRSGGRA
jgi:Ankyrin repeats (3 copies)